MNSSTKDSAAIQQQFADAANALAAELKVPIRKLIVDSVEAFFSPKEWSDFYPRVYNDTGSFTSPKLISAVLGQVVQAALTSESYESLPGAYKVVLPGVIQMTTQAMPMLFVAPELLAAAARTDYEQPIDYMAMDLPFEAGVFVLPENSLLHPTDGYCGFLMWSRMRKGMRIDYDVISAELHNDGFCFATMAHLNNGLPWSYYSIKKDTTPYLDLSAIQVSSDEHSVDFVRSAVKPFQLDSGYTVANFSDLPATQTDSDFIKQMVRLTMNLLLILNARPGLISPAKLVRKVKSKGAVKEFWQPSVVGANYSVQRPKSSGSHDSPRMHWRRGHIRNQPHGPGNTLRRTVFIDPVLVNAPE